MSSIAGIRPELRYAIAALAVSLLISAPVHADEDEPVAAPDDPADVVPADRSIDEIIVVAPRTVGRIRYEIRVAERRMYGLFNELEPDREYHVFCRREKLYASNLKRRICLPQFEHGVMDEVYDSPYGSSSAIGGQLPEGELRRRREVLRQKMIAFAEEHPDLAEAIYHRAQLERDLAEAQARAEEEE